MKECRDIRQSVRTSSLNMVAYAKSRVISFIPFFSIRLLLSSRFTKIHDRYQHKTTVWVFNAPRNNGSLFMLLEEAVG